MLGHRGSKPFLFLMSICLLSRTHASLHPQRCVSMLASLPGTESHSILIFAHLSYIPFCLFIVVFESSFRALVILLTVPSSEAQSTVVALQLRHSHSFLHDPHSSHGYINFATIFLYFLNKYPTGSISPSCLCASSVQTLISNSRIFIHSFLSKQNLNTSIYLIPVEASLMYSLFYEAFSDNLIKSRNNSSLPQNLTYIHCFFFVCLFALLIFVYMSLLLRGS